MRIQTHILSPRVTKPDGRAPFFQFSVVYLLYVGHAKRTLTGPVDFKVPTFLPSLNKMGTNKIITETSYA